MSGKKPTSIGFIDPRKEKGESIFPYLLPREKLDRLPKELGRSVYAGQYQQLPAPAEGAIFREATFEYWVRKTLPQEYGMIIGSWDCTFRESRDSDFVCGQVWGFVDANNYLLGQIRRKMDLATTIKAIKEQRRRWPNMRAVLVEESANGPAVIAILKNEIPGLTAIKVQGESKISRAQATLPIWEAGQVYLPQPDQHGHGWVRDILIPELLHFPEARHDDQVDALTQALNWIQSKRSRGVGFTTLKR